MEQATGIRQCRKHSENGEKTEWTSKALQQLRGRTTSKDYGGNMMMISKTKIQRAEVHSLIYRALDVVPCASQQKLQLLLVSIHSHCSQRPELFNEAGHAKQVSSTDDEGGERRGRVGGRGFVVIVSPRFLSLVFNLAYLFRAD